MRTNALDKSPLTPGVCEWCGNLCEMEDVACSLSCEAQLHRLEATQGRMVLRILKRWRKYRGRKGTPGEGTMSEVAEMVDKFLRQDRIRRERHQQGKRLAEAAATAPEAPKPTKARTQTAAPVQNEPDEAQDDWLKKESDPK